jgi:hypothetical protein
VTTLPVHTAGTSSCSRRDPQGVKVHNARLSLIPMSRRPQTGNTSSNEPSQKGLWESLASLCRGRSSRMRADVASEAGMVANGKPRYPSKLMQEPRATPLRRLTRKLLWCSHDLELTSTVFIISFVPVASLELLCALHASNKSSRLSQVILAANSLNSKYLLDTTSAG